MYNLSNSEFILAATSSSHVTTLLSGVPVVGVAAASTCSYFAYVAMELTTLVLSVAPLSGSPTL